MNLVYVQSQNAFSMAHGLLPFHASFINATHRSEHISTYFVASGFLGFTSRVISKGVDGPAVGGSAVALGT